MRRALGGQSCSRNPVSLGIEGKPATKSAACCAQFSITFCMVSIKNKVSNSYHPPFNISQFELVSVSTSVHAGDSDHVSGQTPKKACRKAAENEGMFSFSRIIDYQDDKQYGQKLRSFLSSQRRVDVWRQRPVTKSLVLGAKACRCLFLAPFPVPVTLLLTKGLIEQLIVIITNRWKKKRRKFQKAECLNSA